MKTKLFTIITFLIIIVCSCTNPSDYHKFSGPTQGTMFNITYNSDKNYNAEIDSLLQVFNKSLSCYDPNSLISRINRNETDSLDEIATKFFTIANEIARATDGYFDITVAPVVNAWGFGWVKNQGHLPDSCLIDSLLTLVGYEKISVVENKIVKQDSRIQVITNAIAQGLAVDFVAAFFDQQGISDYLIEIGGEIYCKGKNAKGTNWQIGIDKPIAGSDYNNRENQQTIQLTNMAVNTSGNYRKFLEEGGKKYGHSINPKTGYSVDNEMLSATVVFPDCVRADAYATAFMVMGSKAAMQIVESIDGMEAYFIVEENGDVKTVESSGFKLLIRN